MFCSASTPVSTHLDLGHLLRGERLEVGRVLGVSLPTSRTQTVALSPQFVPTETTNLENINYNYVYYVSRKRETGRYWPDIHRCRDKSWCRPAPGTPYKADTERERLRSINVSQTDWDIYLGCLVPWQIEYRHGDKDSDWKNKNIIPFIQILTFKYSAQTLPWFQLTTDWFALLVAYLIFWLRNEEC